MFFFREVVMVGCCEKVATNESQVMRAECTLSGWCPDSNQGRMHAVPSLSVELARVR